MKASYYKCEGGESELGLNPPPVPRPATNSLSVKASAAVADLRTGGGIKPIDHHDGLNG